MVALVSHTPGGADMLRTTLVTNGISTALCGLALLVAPGPLAPLLGVPEPGVLAAVGAGLLLYAAGLFWTAAQQPISPAAAWTAIVMDVGWVIGSVALLEVGLLTPIGSGLVSLVAAVVLVFAALQYRGVRRLTHPVAA
jgi:hypothetical protein